MSAYASSRNNLFIKKLYFDCKVSKKYFCMRFICNFVLKINRYGFDSDN